MSDLQPLSAAFSSGLQTLKCRSSSITEIGPLTACTALHTLSVCETAVFDLGPLMTAANGAVASGFTLQTLRFHAAAVSDLTPLAACVNLRILDCSSTPVARQAWNHAANVKLTYLSSLRFDAPSLPLLSAAWLRSWPALLFKGSTAAAALASMTCHR